MYNKFTNLLLKTFMFVMIPLLFCNLTFAQGTVKGMISDPQNNAVPFANVLIVGTNIGAASDVDGNYIISNVSPGTYDLKASAVGYKTVVVSITVTSGETTTQDFTLTQDVLQMEGVVISGTAGGIGIKKKDANFSITTI
ncbi:MAG: carboxypeptidase-like regulatory domain-containing protein, partial [Ignavibacteriaceae bacterium]